MPFIQVGNMVHYCAVDGPDDAPALVFANSLGSDHRIWDEVIPYLADQFHIIRYDQRGHGLSSVGPAPYSIDALADDLAGLLESLGIGDAFICGLSVGGMIAQSFAAAHPDRVRGLMLCDTAMRIGPPSMWDERIDGIRKHGIRALTESIMERWFTPAFRQDRGTELNGYRNMMERTPVEGYIGTCCAIRDADLRKTAASISLPTLVLCGDQDMATPPGLARELADAIAGAKLSLVEDAAHISCVEQPEAFSRLVLHFLEDIKNA
jgi:3-oxoadipate enol-lactonase